MTAFVTPFDILVKNFFDTNEDFSPAVNSKNYHPVDVYENSNGLHLEVACTGIDKKDIEVLIEGQLIRVVHNKSQETTKDDSSRYYTKGISRKAFNLGYKVASRFDASQAKAKFSNGLLIIEIPFAEESKPKTLKIS